MILEDAIRKNYNLANSVYQQEWQQSWLEKQYELTTSRARKTKSVSARPCRRYWLRLPWPHLKYCPLRDLIKKLVVRVYTGNHWPPVNSKVLSKISPEWRKSRLLLLIGCHLHNDKCFTPLTKKFNIAVPPPIKIDTIAVIDCSTKLKFPFTTVKTDCPIDKIMPTFSRPKFAKTVKFRISENKNWLGTNINRQIS